jgi:hypothetical protein
MMCSSFTLKYISFYIFIFDSFWEIYSFRKGKMVLIN